MGHKAVGNENDRKLNFVICLGAFLTKRMGGTVWAFTVISTRLNSNLNSLSPFELRDAREISSHLIS